MSRVRKLEGHQPEFRRTVVGRAAVFRRDRYSYTVTCSCGWSDAGTLTKDDAERVFRQHAKASSTEAAGTRTQRSTVLHVLVEQPRSWERRTRVACGRDVKIEHCTIDVTASTCLKCRETHAMRAVANG